MRREVSRIAKDYDIEWKGELEDLAADSARTRRSDSGSGSVRWAAAGDPDAGDDANVDVSGASAPSSKQSRPKQPEGKDEQAEPREKEGKLDIDKTIDEADAMANETEERRHKRQKGEVMDDLGDEEGPGGKKKREKQIEERGAEKARELAAKSEEAG